MITLKIKNVNMIYDINREAAKYQRHHQVKFINMNILQVKKYYHLVKVE